MTKTDIAVTINIIYMCMGLLTSYIIASTSIKKTGVFLSNVLTGCASYLLFGVLGVLGWFFYTMGINEFLFFGGFVLDISMTTIGEVILLIGLFIRRRHLLQIFYNTK